MQPTTECFTDPVKDHDGVVDGIPRHGQDGPHHRQGKFASQENENSETDKDVMDQGHNGSQGKRALKPPTRIEEDRNHPQHQGNQSFPLQLGSDHTGHLIKLQLLKACIREILAQF